MNSQSVSSSSSRNDGLQQQANAHYYPDNDNEYSKGGGVEAAAGGSASIPDDDKIPQILRQLKRLVAGKQLDEAAIGEHFEKLRQRLRDPTNKGYISRSFDMIASDVVCLLADAPAHLHPVIVNTFAWVGFILQNNFAKYFNFIIKCYKTEEALRLPMLESLRQSVKMNVKLPNDLAAKVVKALKEILEKVDVDIFVAVSDTLAELMVSHAPVFRRFFKDIVDIIVGWHLETDRSHELKLHCGKVLQSLGALWQREQQFTEDLVLQIREDVEAGEGDPVKSTQVGCFIGAFNSIVKCLSLEDGKFCLEEEFLLENFKAILASIERVFQGADEFYGAFDLVVNANEFMLLAVGTGICDGEFSARVLNLIQFEMGMLEKFKDEDVGSVLFVLGKFIPMLVASQPELIRSLFKGNAQLLQKRFSKAPKLRVLLIELYQTVLNLKSVEILKHIYTEIVADLECAMAVLLKGHEDEPNPVYTVEQAKMAVVFNLNVLTKLAMDNTSIIALYACQPSLLEVFVNILQPQSEAMWAPYPEMRQMVVGLLHMHCRQNKNFTTSSNLLKGTSKLSSGYAKESPTCEHLEVILEVLARLLDGAVMSPAAQRTILDWATDLVVDGKGNDHFYNVDPNWQGIIGRVIKLSRGASDVEIIVKTGLYFDQAVELPTLEGDLAREISEICCRRLNSTRPQIRQVYCRVLGGLPLNVALNSALTHLGSTAAAVDGHWRAVVYGNRSESDIWPCYFEELFQGLAMDAWPSAAQRPMEAIIWECFSKCRLAADGEFVERARSNASLLVGWMQWELAKFCVNNKLKTPLGKAQDTFLRIEGLIRQMARIVDNKEKAAFAAEDLAAHQLKARLLLGFLEALEKCIYNAAEGTAYSYPVLEKPIKSWFKLNASTCSAWFKRNRLPMEVVGMEMLDVDMVVRNAEASLRELGRCTEENAALFGHSLVTLVKAYLRLADADSLDGLFEWTGRRHAWIRTAAKQAQNHFEEARDEYEKILQEEGAEEAMGKVISEFIVEQVFVCRSATGGHEEPGSGELKELLHRAFPESALLLEHQYAFDARSALANWDQVNQHLTKAEQPLPFSMRATVHQLESRFQLNAHLLISSPPAKHAINTLTEEVFRTRSEEMLPDLLILQHALRISERQSLGRPAELGTMGVDKCFGTRVLHKVLIVTNALRLQTGEEEETEGGGGNQVSEMEMDLIAVARKEGNLKLAQDALKRFCVQRGLLDYRQMALETIPERLFEDQLQGVVWTEDVVRATFELSKLWHCTPEHRDKAIQLASYVSLKVRAAEARVSDQLRARMLLKIADWIGSKEDDLLSRNREGPVQGLVASLDDFTRVSHFNSDSVVPLQEISVGKLLNHTVTRCPEFGKSWCIFGNWCYKWGRKIIELSHGKRHKSSLQYDYNTEIRRIVPQLKAADIHAIIAVLDDLLIQDSDNDDIGPNDSDAEKVAVATLKNLPALARVEPEKVVKVIGVWHKAHKHIYGCYEIAASAYFKFLQMDNAEEENLHQYTVMITLRLLRLIVKHALSLQDVLEEGLRTTPTAPWKTIIPQLFSRLNHHELYVRRRVSELLCRVAKDAPHIIIFPAVVGCCGQGEAGDVSSLLVAPVAAAATVEGRGDAAVNENRELLTCFQALVATLSKQASDTVAQVQVLVRELQRIGLLWDELWLVAMTRVYADFNKRMQAMEADKEGNLTDKEAIQLTVSQFKQLLLNTMGKLKRVTGAESQTKNEVIFQTRYRKHIDALTEATKEISDRKSCAKAWNQFKSFYGVLHQRASRRSASVLKMEDISPVLYGLKETAISMPGVDNEGSLIYIRAVTNSVQILPTKTRPKKFAFIGDDSRQYNYLFKGLEDLHLDERIMQFLSISNTIMRKASQKIAYGYDYRARHYSVIPLGTQSGLINWVDGVVPIFSLYKRWQQREAAKTRKANEKASPTVMRPSELFYSKVSPLLAEHKLDVHDNRKLWPGSVLRRVLDELSAETPRDLLAKEFWCNSTTTAGWRQTVKNYSLSVAVMSVIGYIIGLGDRHLDNVLVDVATGEILHIDYNVCFEKGKTLRVPEKIPFRMTQNFQEALGLTGIEGTFRLTCETVLKSLKKHRETLLTLLEAFVYDPLVDWTVSHEDAEIKPSKAAKGQSVAQQATASSSAGKANSDNLQCGSGLKQQWKASRDEIQKSNQQLEDCQRSLSARLQTKSTIEADLQAAHQELALITSFNLEQCQILRMKYDTYRGLQKVIEESCEWSQGLMLRHAEFFAKFSDGELQQFIDQFQTIRTNAIVFEFEQIQPIFMAANHLELFVKSRELSLELTTCVLNLGQTIQQVYDLLTPYKGVLDQLSPTELGQHFLNRYRGWCEGLVEGFKGFDLSVGQCQRIGNEMHEQGAFGANINRNAAAVTTFAHGLLTNIQDLSIQQQLLSTLDVGELQRRYEMAQGVVGSVDKGTEQHRKVHHFNFTVLWELHKKYQQILTSDLSKLRYEIGLNSYLFWEHAQLAREVAEPEKTFCNGFMALQKCTNIYEWMHEMKYKFTEEVIPLSVRAIFTRDPHVVDMVTKLWQCHPNGELKALEKGLREQLDVALEQVYSTDRGPKGCQPSPDCQAVKGIKYQLAELYKSYANEKHVGAQIYKCFYELFESLEEKFVQVAVVLFGQVQLDAGSVETTLSMNHKGGNKLGPAIICHRSVITIVRQLYLVKKLDALIEFFVLVMNNWRAFQGNVDATIYNDQTLFNPIKEYLNDFLYNVMFEIGGLCQEVVLRGLMKALAQDQFKRLEDFAEHCEMEWVVGGGDEEPIHMGLLRDMTMYWEKTCKNYYIQKMVQGQEMEIKRLQTMLNGHAWIYDEVYQLHSIQTGGLTRGQFLQQLRPLLQQLHGWNATIVKMRQELGVLGEQIKHDLQWADAIFKPLITNYENQAALKEKALNTIQSCSQGLHDLVECVTSYEALRAASPETYELSKQLVELIEQIIIMCEQGVGLERVEAKVVEEVPAEEYFGVTPEWQTRVIERLHCRIQEAQEADSRVEGEIRGIETVIRQETLQLLKHVPGLKNILVEVQTLTNPTGAKDCLLSKYTRCMEVVCAGLHEIELSPQFDRLKSIETIENFNKIIACLKKTMVELKLDDEADAVGRTRAKAESQPKQNSYAVSVWRRVRMKLEGRDPDSSKRMSVEDQVDWMIREATNLDNLAVLYEGWTPWV